MKHIKLNSLLIAGLVVGSLAPAVAQENESRFELRPEGDGFVRLDRQDGTMSHCSMENGKLVCRTAAEEREAYTRALSDLQAQIDGLKQRLAALEGSADNEQDGNVAAAEPSPGESGEPKPPVAEDENGSDQELEKAMEFAQDAMQRFVEAVRRLREDYENRSSP